MPTTKVAIGILAWNEEDSIAGTIASLCQQNLVTGDGRPDDWQVACYCIPNGCSDATAQRAEAAFKEHLGPGDQTGGSSWQVHERRQPGKVRALNALIHELLPADIDVLVMLDADIVFEHADCLSAMVRHLQEHSEAAAATSNPIKDIAHKERPSLWDRISLITSRTNQASPGQLTGQCYAIRMSVMRGFLMPAAIIVEDGFIKQMLVTDCMQRDPIQTVIQPASGAAHRFQAYTKMSEIFATQKRQAVGHVLQHWLLTFLRRRLAKGVHAGELLHAFDKHDGLWFYRLIDTRIRQGGWWLMYPGSLSFRFRRLCHLKTSAMLMRLPLTCAAWCLDVIVHLVANSDMRHRRFKSAWPDTKTVLADGTHQSG